MDKNINNIINHIKSIKNGSNPKKGVCVLIGAGADLSSGGVLFRELKLLFLKENGCAVSSNITDKMLDEKFEEVINQISQESRCETLDAIMKRYKTPSEGYSLLVMLAEMGYIDAVITTNFDYLLEDTQALLNLTPFTIFTPGRAVPEEYYIHRTKNTPVYIKMHGDLSARLVTHLTTSEIQSKKYGENFIKLIKHIISNNSLIIVGYGGYDSLITEVFEMEIDNIDEVYWCNISSPKDDSGLANLIQENNKLSFVNITFDKLFQEIAKLLLKDVQLKNTNPIFLPTVVQSKIDNQISLFEKKIDYKNKLIKREKAHENLDEFLTTIDSDSKCLAVIGEYKYGKTCFVYKSLKGMRDITYIPVVCNNHDSILEHMAQTIGYYTDVPFPILYSFLKWWEKRERQLVFVIDGFFNLDYYIQRNVAQTIDFFNFLYIVREFKNIQFIICFQNDVFNKLEADKTFASFGNIISKKIYIEEFLDEEVRKLLKQNGADDETICALEKQKILHIPYVWEILNRNNITLTTESNCFAQYIDALYILATNNYTFSKHKFNAMLEHVAYNQLFYTKLPVDVTSEEFKFLQNKEMVDDNCKIIYLELVIYLCKQYLLRSDSWENVVTNIIESALQNADMLSESQISVYVSILGDISDIEMFNIVFTTLDKMVNNSNLNICLKKLIIKVLQQCVKTNRQLFISYLESIDINIYSLSFQYYLFKVCAEFCPEELILWYESSKDSKLLYAYFLLSNDKLYNLCKRALIENIETDYTLYFNAKDNLVRLCHLLTYWGWDNTTNIEYKKFKNHIIEKIFPVIKSNNIDVNYSVSLLKKYAYNIFFNAGQDFEEQYSQCHKIDDIVKSILSKKTLTTNQYLELLELNTDINNSWIFVVSNILVVQAMKNQPIDTYNMLLYFWDNIDFKVQPQHLDFYLSSAFWSLYLSAPNNRTKFVKLFENIVEKYDRILFLFPETKRRASILKFSQEFERTFEDGFNPIAFFFYTAPYQSITKQVDWDYGKTELKVYWELAEYMDNLGKYDDILRIVHALGQMISIFPEEGYSALQNMTKYNHPIIKKGLIHIFKENYLRYKEITKREMEKSIYHFNEDDLNEIIYNSDFLLENRTMEQLHWGRLFYNLEQLFHIDVSEVFLSHLLQSQSCLEFLRDFISFFIK